jgi:hypothetical protein
LESIDISSATTVYSNAFNNCTNLIAYVPQDITFNLSNTSVTQKHVVSDDSVKIENDTNLKYGTTFNVLVDATKFGGDRSKYTSAKYLESVNIIANETSGDEDNVLTNYYTTDGDYVGFSVNVTGSGGNTIRAEVIAYDWTEGADSHSTDKIYYVTKALTIGA